MLKHAVYIFVLIGACVYNAGCVMRAPNAGSQSYIPLYAAYADATKTEALNPKEGDWHWAGTSRTLQEAVLRWQMYLEKHYSQNDLEDGWDFYKRQTAKYELMRIYYLLGDQSKGDKILNDLDPLGLFGASK